MNTSVKKFRAPVIIAFFSISVVCFVYAAPKGGGMTDKQKAADCNHRAVEFTNDCIFRNTPINATQSYKDDIKQQCTEAGIEIFMGCMTDAGITSKRPTGLQPPKSLPTATPPKGPIRTNPPAGKNNPIPTPSASPPQLFAKPGKGSPTPSTKGSPTPSTSPKKRDHEHEEHGHHKG